MSRVKGGPRNEEVGFHSLLEHGFNHFSPNPYFIFPTFIRNPMLFKSVQNCSSRTQHSYANLTRRQFSLVSKPKLR